MPRAPRIAFDGAVFHIVQRGNNKEYIFNQSKHKNFFLKLIKENGKSFDFELLAYTVMSNHYHLLMRVHKDSLSDIMFNINNVYSKYLNRENERTGHVYEDRYYAKLVENDAYLMWVLRYIHRNPIRAGICTSLDEYRWTSHFFYKNAISNSFINTNFILGIFSKNKYASIKQYYELINFKGDVTDKEKDLKLFKEKFNHFSDKMSGYREINYKKEIPARLGIEEIFNNSFTGHDSKDLMLKNTRTKEIISQKLSFIQSALKNNYTVNEISEFLNSTPSAVYKILSRHNIPIH